MLYLVEHAAVPHHAALGVHVLAAALPGHLDDALYFWGNGQLPAEFSGEILERGKRAGTCHQAGTRRPETAVRRHVPQFIVWGLCCKKQTSQLLENQGSSLGGRSGSLSLIKKDTTASKKTEDHSITSHCVSEKKISKKEYHIPVHWASSELLSFLKVLQEVFFTVQGNRAKLYG